MPDKRIALVTGANQGVGLQVAKELVANGVTVLFGSRNFERGEAAAREIGAGAIALQLDVTDRVSIADAAERVRKEFAASICWFKTRLSRIPERAACPFRSTPR
jgi:NAD(P)-dependent dehydrogenase (short-subunit alcohol dehydrogenase family)